MKILGWNAYLAEYVFLSILTGFVAGNLISKVYTISWGTGAILLAIFFLLSLYLWHFKGLKEIYMK
jgi:hypothetical protein